jgi:adenosylhomocysteine nucleosidase
VTHEGMLGKTRIVAATSGPGRDAARRATKAVLRGHRPRRVLTTGFAGGLDEGLRRGDLLVADTVVDCHGGSLAADIALPDPAATARAYRTGTLLTVDQVIRTPTEKRCLGQQYHAMAVDMETFAVAEACRHNEVPWLAIRVIHDTVTDQLPEEVDHLLRQKTLAGRAGAVAGALFRRPSVAQDMWNLQQVSLEVSQHLAELLAGLLPQLAKTAARE